MKRGVTLDTETTGLDKEKDGIIEMTLIPFEFTSNSCEFTKICSPITQFNDPGVEMNEEASTVNGITEEMFRGKRFQRDLIEDVLNESDFIFVEFENVHQRYSS